MNKDKAKELTNNLWSKTKTNFARTRQKTLELLGKAEKIVDVNFNQEKEKFIEHHKAVQKVNIDAARLVAVMQDLSIAQATLAEDFYNMYESSASLYNAALKNQDVAKFIDNARTQTETTLKTDMMDPISKYLTQFKELNQRLGVQDTRKLDLERYARDVKIYTEKNNKEKLAVAEPKMETARVNYDNLTDELMHDLPALYEDRVAFFDPVFATYLSSMAEFYRQSAKITNEALSLVAQVNRQTVHNHPMVITLPEQSVAAISTNTPTNPGKTGSSEFATVNADKSSTETVVSVPIEEKKTPVTTSTPSAVNTAPARALPQPGQKPTAPPKKSGVRAKALYDFAGTESGELPFVTNDVLTILTQPGEWWEAELNGKKGLIPANYVEVMK